MSLTQKQVEALLRPIHPSRVLQDNKGMAHVSQQDVRAHLTRIFGFAGWSDELLDLTLIREAPGIGRDGKEKGWAVTYRATVRLTVRDQHGQFLASYDDVGTGTSPNLPTLGDAHDFACKVAVSMALKRAATNLGDGFGLSLYNKGQRAALVKGTLVMPEGDGEHVEEVPEQVSMGHDDAGSVETVEEITRALTTSERPAERQGRARKGSTPDVDEDPFAAPEWATPFRTRLAKAMTPEALADRWEELQQAVANGEVSPEWGQTLKGEIGARKAHLEAEEATPAEDVA